MTTVIVEYPTSGLPDADLDERIRETAEAMGGEEIGDGAGLGWRDLQFVFEDSTAARRLCSTVQGFGLDIKARAEDDDT